MLSNFKGNTIEAVKKLKEGAPKRYVFANGIQYRIKKPKTKDTMLHRIDGPAVINDVGADEWWVNGQRIPNEELHQWNSFISKQNIKEETISSYYLPNNTNKPLSNDEITYLLYEALNDLNPNNKTTKISIMSKNKNYVNLRISMNSLVVDANSIHRVISLPLLTISPDNKLEVFHVVFKMIKDAFRYNH